MPTSSPSVDSANLYTEFSQLGVTDPVPYGAYATSSRNLNPGAAYPAPAPLRATDWAQGYSINASNAPRSTRRDDEVTTVKGTRRLFSGLCKH